MLGEEKPPYPRAASIQKVARTVDIDIVGTTARHLTFFEMLGNFSFGDYFKEKAIPWAYELVTEGFGLDPDRLWYTVHLTDSEAEQIWIDGVGVPPGRVQRMDRDNFWQMGIAGPCGPSSEIFYDRGPEYGADGGPEVDDERFMEVWNLVFMQNIQDEPYHVIGDLPAKNIDTGAGLERIATVLQEVDTLFETDLVRPVMAAGEAHTKVPYGADPGSDVSLRILGDHGRAVTFLLSDGVVPSNEGRGYVLRRLLRRAVRHAFLLGSRDVVMPSLIDATVDLMQQAHPVLRQRRPDPSHRCSRRCHRATRRAACIGPASRDRASAPWHCGHQYP
jgi:alanyl-tRNA synthetase